MKCARENGKINDTMYGLKIRKTGPTTNMYETFYTHKQEKKFVMWVMNTIYPLLFFCVYLLKRQDKNN
jgi:hypothetical protein